MYNALNQTCRLYTVYAVYKYAYEHRAPRFRKFIFIRTETGRFLFIDPLLAGTLASCALQLYCSIAIANKHNVRCEAKFRTSFALFLLDPILMPMRMHARGRCVARSLAPSFFPSFVLLFEIPSKKNKKCKKGKQKKRHLLFYRYFSQYDLGFFFSRNYVSDKHFLCYPYKLRAKYVAALSRQDRFATRGSLHPSLRPPPVPRLPSSSAPPPSLPPPARFSAARLSRAVHVNVRPYARCARGMRAHPRLPAVYDAAR